MNNKFISIFLIFILLFSSISCVLGDDDDNSYTIDLADIFLIVNPNGLLHVNESYVYNFNGEFHGVYRDIPLKDGQSIDNLKVYADGAYTKVEQVNEDGYKKLKVYLYSDEAKTQPVHDTKVVVHYTYDFKNAIKIYTDVGELQYKLWGEEWDVTPSQINAHIQFSDSKGIEYWINPYYIDSTEKWNGNTLELTTNNIPSGEYFEFRSVIPLNQFSNPVYASNINHAGYDEIVKIQQDYENNIQIENAILTIVPLILLISLAFPVYAYIKYGREPKINYNAEYEHEPPTDDSPIFVDALFSTKTDVGKVSDNGIQATIMEMIGDKIIKIDESSSKGNLKLILPLNTSGLEFYKADIVNLLRPFEKNGVVDLNDMGKHLNHSFHAEKFNETLHLIKRDYEDEFVKPVLRRYFISKGSDYFKIYAIILMIASVIMIALSALFDNPTADSTLIISIITLIVGVIILKLPNKIGGKWTNEGYTDFKMWKNFEKFIKDFSLIKEHPPESIAIWNKYLIYATALGDAKAVKKAMASVGESMEWDDDLYYYSYYGGPLFFTNAITTSHTTMAEHNGIGNVGNIGGGSGGGGGGAF